MGATPSIDISAIKKTLSDARNTQYFGVFLVFPNKLALILSKSEVTFATKRVLGLYWQIENINEIEGLAEFTLKEVNWMLDDVKINKFICSLLKEYYSIGWYFKIATSLQRIITDRNLIIFEQSVDCLSTNFVCLSLNNTDKIRVIGSDSLVDSIRQTILNNWPKGIQKEANNENFYQFKLKGNPWSAMSTDGVDSYHTAAMVNGLLSTLYKKGWILTASISIPNILLDLNALYFRYDPIETDKDENLNSKFFALSLNQTDRIRVINASLDVINEVKSTIEKNWANGIQQEKEINGAYEFKLKGNPWSSKEFEAVESRKLIGCLFNSLYQRNWNVYNVFDINKSKSRKSCLFFRSFTSSKRQHLLNSLCLSFNDTENIRLVNRNEGLVHVLRNCIQIWPFGIQKESEYYGAWEFKLNQCPFNINIYNALYTSIMLISIIENFEKHGFKFLMNVNTCGRSIEGKDHLNSLRVDLDSFYFQKN